MNQAKITDAVHAIYEAARMGCHIYMQPGDPARTIRGIENVQAALINAHDMLNVARDAVNEGARAKLEVVENLWIDAI